MPLPARSPRSLTRGVWQTDGELEQSRLAVRKASDTQADAVASAQQDANKEICRLNDLLQFKVRCAVCPVATAVFHWHPCLPPPRSKKLRKQTPAGSRSWPNSSA